MLTRLTVSNYALINELSVGFHMGLNSVTGETGAGKSIILGALGLITGNRADLTVLKNKDEKCIVEGTFEMKNYNLERFFEDNDLDYDPLTILRREITPSGKSRAFINDTPVNVKTLRQLGLKLIDIHSQHQNLDLGNQAFQMELVDTVSGSAQVYREYQKNYNSFLTLKKKLNELMLKSEKANSDLDYYQFQLTQLKEANLQEDEQEELESELEKLTHSEEIKTAFAEAQILLDNEQFSAIRNIKESLKMLTGIQNFVAEAPSLAERMQITLIELKDILNEMALLEEKTEHDPKRIEFINDRLNLIYSLQQKHHKSTVAELMELKNSFEEKINQVTAFDVEIEAVKKQQKELRQKLEVQASELSAVRRRSFEKIEKAVVNDLRLLGMPKSKLIVQHELLPEFGPGGVDRISFLFSANIDIAPSEISKIASGGEMSRLMLAIKNLLRISKTLPTIIFDEIDSGVSGEIALKMGTILKDFSVSTQIINITHLPQIAAKGDAHFLVYKYERENKTFTSIKQLGETERVEELAKMVGGENLSENTMETARELLKT